MKHLLCFLALLASAVTLCAQNTTEELANELKFMRPGEEWGDKRDKAFRLLELDPLNKQAVMYLGESYYRLGPTDSLAIFFNDLQDRHPDSTLPYLYRVEITGRFRMESLEEQINHLYKAYAIDSTDMVVVYQLGKKYYKAFLQEYKDKKPHDALLESAGKAILFLERYYRETTLSDVSAWAALMQLYGYTGNPRKQSLAHNTFPEFYFPPLAFSEIPVELLKSKALPDNWDTDYSIDIMWSAEMATSTINWYSRYLSAFKEPNLRHVSAGETFRFTWLRTFHRPIVIRAEKCDGTAVLYWKTSNGAGGYETGKPSLTKSRELSSEEWARLTKVIRAGNFWDLPSASVGELGFDGAQWVLEANQSGQYHVVDRWGGGEIREMCLVLLRLTGMRVKDIY